MPRRDTGEARIGRSNGSGVPTRLHRLLAYPLAQVNVGVVEVLEKFGKERVTIRGHCLLNSLKHGASTPSGLSPVFNKNGGTPLMITALLTSFDPYFPM